MNLFAELKRRNVFRVGAVYLAVSWLLTQVAGSLESAIGLPDWFDGMVVALLALGLPVALLLAWAFELTPEGLKRTSRVEEGGSIAAKTGRRLDYILLGAVALAIVVVIADRLVPRAAAPASVASAAAPSGAALDDKSIAVLPFVDLSPESDQGYFADGLSEELLNVLAQSRDLRVAGRTSSFAYKGRNVDLREIGEALGVAHILEGSVRKSGQRIRVTAQLIKASDGYHVFSDTYDRNLADIFAVQDDIAGKIGDALMTRLSGETAQEVAPTELEAYDLYLLARQRIYTRDPEEMRSARVLLDRALAIDPDYAPALAQKAILIMLLSSGSGSYGDIPITEAAAEAETLARRAIALAPDLAEAHAALGLMLSNSNAPLDDVEVSLNRAIEINPSLSDAQNWLANALNRRGDFKRAQDIYEAVIERDPLYRPAFSNLVSQYVAIRDFEKTERLLARIERIAGKDNPYTLLPRGLIAWDRGELAQAARYLKHAIDLGATSNTLRNTYASTMAQLGEFDEALTAAPLNSRPALLHLAGRREEATAAATALHPLAATQYEVLPPIVYDFFVTNRAAEAVEFVETVYGSPEQLAELSAVAAASWGPILALSYRAIGREEEAAKIIDLIDEVAALDRADGSDGFYYWYSMAEVAALRGERDLALERLAVTLDRGNVDVSGIAAPTFDSLRDDPRFQALDTEVFNRANAEREKLGLDPLPRLPGR